jgi:hypothetical protein
MGAFTTTYERIIRQPALTMPGNFTGSEAACTAGNASSIRTLLSLGTADSPTFSGLTLTGNLLFSPTNTYDVGNGTYDPRTVRAATSVLTPLLNNTNAAALIVGNSTYGVSIPGNITSPGPLSQSEKFGALANASGAEASAFGYNSAAGTSASAFGHYASATTQSVAFGEVAGYNATGLYYTALGYNTQPGSYNSGILLGHGAANTASNQMQIGSAGKPITQQRFSTGGGSLTFANETGTFLTVANNGAVTISNSQVGSNQIRDYALRVLSTNGNANGHNKGIYIETANASGNYSLDVVGRSFFTGEFIVTGPMNLTGAASLTTGVTSSTANLQLGDSTSTFAGGNGGVLSFAGDDRGQGYPWAVFASIKGIKENSTYLNSLGALVFGTQSNSGAAQNLSTVTEKMRITSGGNLLVGTTTNDGTSKLQVAGAATFSGDISMQHPTQGYIRAYGGYSLDRNTNIYHDTSNGYLNSSHGGLYLTSQYGNVHVDRLNGLAQGGMLRVGYGYSTWVVFNGHISYNAGVRIYSKATTTHALGLSGLPGQTAALFECEDSGGNDLFTVEVTGASRNWSSSQTKYTQTIHDGTNGIVSTSSGRLQLQGSDYTVLAPVTGTSFCFTNGTNSQFWVYNSAGSKYAYVTHDNTNGVFGTSSGTMVLSPTTQIINLFGASSTFPAIARDNTQVKFRTGDNLADAPVSCAGITASGVIYSSAGFTFPPDVYLNTPGPHPRMYFVSSGASIWACGTNSGSLHQFQSLAGSTLLEVYSTGTVVTGTLTHTGGQQTGYVAKTANYTTTADDHLVNVTANSIDITLETAVGCAGRVHEIFNSGSGTVTMKTTSAQTISGSASGALTLAQWKSMTVKSDGANWLIMSQIT